MTPKQMFNKIKLSVATFEDDWPQIWELQRASGNIMPPDKGTLWQVAKLQGLVVAAMAFSPTGNGARWIRKIYRTDGPEGTAGTEKLLNYMEEGTQFDGLSFLCLAIAPNEQWLLEMLTNRSYKLTEFVLTKETCKK